MQVEVANRDRLGHTGSRVKGSITRLTGGDGRRARRADLNCLVGCRSLNLSHQAV